MKRENYLLGNSFCATDEQDKIIRDIVNDNTKAIEVKNTKKIYAFAGTGKTETLMGIILHNRTSKILYLVFDKPMQENSKQKIRNLGINNFDIKAQTTTSLAYQAVVQNSLMFSAYDYKHYTLSKIFNIPKKDAHRSILVFDFFCKSALDSFQEIRENLNAFDEISFVSQRDIDIAESLFEKIDNGTEKQTFLYIVKKFELKLKNGYSSPAIDGIDILMLDEAQDTSNIVISIFKLLKAKQKVIVGDVHQQLYSFMGSVNAMSKIEGDVYYLSNSFRFNTEIGDKANHFLSMFKNETKRLVGVSNNKTKKSLVSITRGNAKLIESVVDFVEEGTYFKTIRNPDLIFSLTLDFCLMLENRESSIKRNFHIKNYKTGYIRNGKDKSLEEYILAESKKYKDFEDMGSIKAIQRHGIDKIRMCAKIAQDNYENNTPAEYFITTAHSSKGKEWDIVFIEDDFKSPLNVIADALISVTDLSKKHCNIPNMPLIEKSNIFEVFYELMKEERIEQSFIEDLNLWYVATTRAKTELRFDENIVDLSTIPETTIRKDIVDFYHSGITELLENKPTKKNKKKKNNQDYSY